MMIVIDDDNNNNVLYDMFTNNQISGIAMNGLIGMYVLASFHL